MKLFTLLAAILAPASGTFAAPVSDQPPTETALPALAARAPPPRVGFPGPGQRLPRTFTVIQGRDFRAFTDNDYAGAPDTWRQHFPSIHAVHALLV